MTAPRCEPCMMPAKKILTLTPYFLLCTFCSLLSNSKLRTANYKLPTHAQKTAISFGDLPSPALPRARSDSRRTTDPQLAAHSRQKWRGREGRSVHQGATARRGCGRFGDRDGQCE